MSSADTTAAKKAAGQLQKDQGDLQDSHDLKKSGHATFQHAQGVENADKETGAHGFSPVQGAKDFVQDKAQQRTQQ